MNEGTGMHWIRVLGSATVYFFIYAISIVYFTIRSLPPTPEYSWYFRDLWIALRTIVSYALFEVPRSPLMMLSLFTVMAKSLFLGFVTDWGLRILKRRRERRVLTHNSLRSEVR